MVRRAGLAVLCFKASASHSIIGCFYGSYLGLAFGVAICLLTLYMAPVFNPTHALRSPIDRQAHEEVIAFINQKLEDTMGEAATSPYVVPERPRNEHPDEKSRILPMTHSSPKHI